MKVNIIVEYEYDINPRDYMQDNESIPLSGKALIDRIMECDYGHLKSLSEYNPKVTVKFFEEIKTSSDSDTKEVINEVYKF